MLLLNVGPSLEQKRQSRWQVRGQQSCYITTHNAEVKVQSMHHYCFTKKHHLRVWIQFSYFHKRHHHTVDSLLLTYLAASPPMFTC